MVESSKAAKQQKFDPMACNDKNLLVKKALDIQKSIEKKERQLETELEIQRDFNVTLKKQVNVTPDVNQSKETKYVKKRGQQQN